MSEGRRGSEPPWYRTMVAAKLAGTAPWEMDEQSLFWQEHVIAAAALEADVAKRKAKRRPGALRSRGRR